MAFSNDSLLAASVAGVLVGGGVLVGSGYLFVQLLHGFERSSRLQYGLEQAPPFGTSINAKEAVGLKGPSGRQQGQGGWVSEVFSSTPEPPVGSVATGSWRGDSSRWKSFGSSSTSRIDTATKDADTYADPIGRSAASSVGAQARGEATLETTPRPGKNDRGREATRRAAPSGLISPSVEMSSPSFSSPVETGARPARGGATGRKGDARSSGLAGNRDAGNIGGNIDPFYRSTLASRPGENARPIREKSQLAAIAGEAERVARTGHKIVSRLDRMSRTRSRSASRTSQPIDVVYTKDREDPGSPPPIPVEDDLHWLVLAGGVWGTWRLWCEPSA